MESNMKLLIKVAVGLAVAVVIALVSVAIMFPVTVVDASYKPSAAHPVYAAGRGPRLCIDEFHNNVHTLGGTYRPFGELMLAAGFRVSSSDAQFDSSSLSKCDVMVISNAMGAPRYRFYGFNLPIRTKAARQDPAFSNEEVSALSGWVRQGGSLLLIADHYPCGPAAQKLALAFGVRMSGGYTEARSNQDKNSKDPGQLIYSRANGLLGRHPITDGRSASERVQTVTAFTGQALMSSVGTSLLSLPKDAVDTIPAGPRSHPTSVGGQSQAIAAEIGRGRVVILGEAAMLSAQRGPDGFRFGMNKATNDNEKFALNIAYWLAGAL
jgi:hypothetical protein